MVQSLSSSEHDAMWFTRPRSFINAAVLSPGGEVFGSLRVHGTIIDSLGDAPDRRDVVIDLDGSVVLPGLINAHDHLELNSFGRLKWRDRYCNVSEWIADFQPRFAADPSLTAARPETLDDRLWVGAFKNLLAGVTTVCHHNPLHTTLKRRYPVRVVRNYGFSHSLDIDGDEVAASHRRTPANWPWIVHAAEGTDARAAAEIDALTSLGCVTPNTVIVHGVALTPDSADKLLSRGGALVWCPTSNAFLFGRTADVRQFDDAGRLAIGSDSRLSGEGDLLDEIRAAHATRQLTADSLFHAATDGGARVLRLAECGTLMPGCRADLCVLRRNHAEPLDTLVTARRGDVRMTMVAGRALLSDPELSAVFESPHNARAVIVDGARKLMDSKLARRAATLKMHEAGLEVAPC